MKLSVITINRNNAGGLEKTIRSVIGQTFTGFEYIVIDGNSGDGSAGIIKQYADKISYWVSEPDTGIYNAMNKGIKKARGDYCLFLNSGDYLINHKTLAEVLSRADGGADIYYADCVLSDGKISVYPEKLDVNYLIKGPISHQNALMRRSLFTEHGLYNEALTIGSDWEYFLKEMWIYKTRFSHLPSPLAVFDVNGIGSRDPNLRRREKEIIYKNVFGDLSGSLMELYSYRRSVYSDILKRWGWEKVRGLEFFLRVYHRLRKILDGFTMRRGEKPGGGT
jgi:glycosyltransferase involved in cell wall biosynthesis